MTPGELSRLEFSARKAAVKPLPANGWNPPSLRDDVEYIVCHVLDAIAALKDAWNAKKEQTGT